MHDHEQHDDAVKGLAELTTDGMLAEHGCWTSSCPKGVVPGHVVLTLDDDDHPTHEVID